MLQELVCECYLAMGKRLPKYAIFVLLTATESVAFIRNFPTALRIDFCSFATRNACIRLKGSTFELQMLPGVIGEFYLAIRKRLPKYAIFALVTANNFPAKKRRRRFRTHFKCTSHQCARIREMLYVSPV